MTVVSVNEHKKFCGPILNIIRALTSKVGNLLSHFDKIDESEAKIENTTLHHHLINNDNVAANKVKSIGQLPPEHICGFSKVSKRILNNYGFI